MCNGYVISKWCLLLHISPASAFTFSLSTPSVFPEKRLLEPSQLGGSSPPPLTLGTLPAMGFLIKHHWQILEQAVPLVMRLNNIWNLVTVRMKVWGSMFKSHGGFQTSQDLPRSETYRCVERGKCSDWQTEKAEPMHLDFSSDTRPTIWMQAKVETQLVMSEWQPFHLCPQLLLRTTSARAWLSYRALPPYHTVLFSSSPVSGSLAH